MQFKSTSIRAFIGAKNYQESRAFYQDLGFEEISLGAQMSYFKVDEKLGFYLQNAYVKDWVDNTMIFLEVEDLDACAADLSAKKLEQKYKNVRISNIKVEEWGRELFMHDPSGILWHFGEFEKKQS